MGTAVLSKKCSLEAQIDLQTKKDDDVRIPTPKIAHTCPLVMTMVTIIATTFKAQLHEEMLSSTFYLPMPKKCSIKQEKCHKLSISKKYCDILQSIHHFSFPSALLYIDGCWHYTNRIITKSVCTKKKKK